MADHIGGDGLYRIGRTTLMRDKSVDGSWLLKIPQHVITSLNRSTAIGYGTSFDHNKSVTLWMVSGGTWAGVAGTNIGIFIGTGIVG